MDMLVKLYDLEETDLIKRLSSVNKKEITVRRAMAYEKENALLFVRTHFAKRWLGWPSECDVAFSKSPISCFIATHQKEIVGFACYNSTAKGLFGPMGVKEDFRKKGVGSVLLLISLLAMREEGYAYASIGGAQNEPKFYERITGAIVIPKSDPGIYRDMLQGIET